MKTKSFFLIAMIVISLSSCQNEVDIISDNANFILSYDNSSIQTNVLAGNIGVIADIKVSAKQDTKTKTLSLVFSSSDIYTSLDDIEVYYKDQMIGTSPVWDLNGKRATFKDLDWVIQKTTEHLKVVIKPRRIDEDGGVLLKNISITNVEIAKCTGVENGESLNDTLFTQESTKFNIVPAITVVGIANLGTTTGNLMIACNKGENLVSIKIKAITVKITNNTCLTTLKIKDNSGSYLGETAINGNGEYNISINQEVANGNISFILNGIIKSVDSPSYNVHITSVIYECDGLSEWKIEGKESLILQKGNNE